MFKSLFRCIRRFFSRIKPQHREALQRRNDYGANIDIEDALAEELEIQRRSGRTLSSTASIVAALRHRPRDTIPVFTTQLGNDEHREPSNPAIEAAVEEMQSLTVGQTSEKSESLANAKSPAMGAKSPMVSKRVTSSRISSSFGSSCKIPESVREDAEPEDERETESKKKTISAGTEIPSELNPRRSSIFDMRSEWI